MSDSWYALHVKPRFEKYVTGQLSVKGYETFMPSYVSKRKWSDRVKTLSLPLFPGYVFCRLSPEDRLPLLMIPGAMHFVGIGKTPVPIEESEMAAIQAAIQSGLALEPWEFLDVGQRVRLEEGPLARLKGIYAGNSKQDRIVVSVNLLRRSVAVTIERHWVTPLDAARRPIPPSIAMSLPPTCQLFGRP